MVCAEEPRTMSLAGWPSRPLPCADWHYRRRKRLYLVHRVISVRAPYLLDAIGLCTDPYRPFYDSQASFTVFIATPIVYYRWRSGLALGLNISPGAS